MRRRPAAAVTVLALAVASLAGVAPPATAATAPAAPYDLNGDGYAELVVGAPRLPVGGVEEAGGFAVLSGSRKGLSRSTRLVTRATTGVPGDPAARDALGSAVASADVDADGYADLAVAADGDGVTRPASLLVLPGSRTGLDLARTVVVPRPSDVGPGVSWSGHLATGDLDGDGVPDLVVGSETEGVVRVFPGGRGGLRTTASVVLRNPGDEASFGSALATGDVDGDGVDDLVVGARGVQVNDWGLPGAVSLCPGRRGGGPTACHTLASGYPLANLSSLAVGNVTGDARAEVVVGDGGWDDQERGEMHVLRLSGSGATTTADDLVLTQASRGVPGADEQGDRFGETVRLADLDRDGWDDLVVTAPGENAGAGRVTIVRGARSGWATRGNRTLDLGTRGVPGRADRGDGFGTGLALLDHDGDGRVDLDVAVPGERARGSLTTLRGVRGGFAPKGSRTATVPGLVAPAGGENQRWVLGVGR